MISTNDAPHLPFSDLARKNEIIERSLLVRNGKPLFSVVEINVANICTRHCEFCPISYSEYIAPHGMMTSEVVTNIINSLRSITYRGMILFSGFCEPLLYKPLVDIISQLRDVAQYSHIEINTNGDILTPSLAKQLFSAGCSTISISVYDGLSAMEKFNKFRIANHFSDSQIILRRRFFNQNDYGFIFSNRTGCIPSGKYSPTIIDELPLCRACYYPFYYTVIDTDGTVLSCPHDCFRKSRLGNILEKPLTDIWLDAPLKSLRQRLLHKDRSTPQCARCTTDGMLMGQKHLDAWSAFYNAQPHDGKCTSNR